MPAELTELRVRDVTIKLHRAGRGQKVLFLHGAGGVPQWLPFFDTLAERYELLVPEHPGFGGSDDPAWIHSMSDLAMFYLDLVEAAGLDRIHLIGNSLGGWLAAEILIRRVQLTGGDIPRGWVPPPTRRSQIRPTVGLRSPLPSASHPFGSTEPRHTRA
jgi:pimeloyl-ACP methyl ester carboxylesterase